MFYILLSVYSWLIVLLSFFIMFPVAVIIWLSTILFDKRLVCQHWFSCVWASSFIWLNPLWSVRITGKEKIDPSTAYVMICNHQSMLDIVVLYRLFVHFKWIAKKELFKIPVVGWNMLLNKYVAVDRGNKHSHLKMMHDALNHLKLGSSIMIFPEGTRSKDGELLYFKEGAFKMAIDAKVPILPIVLDGTSDLLPKHGLILKNKGFIRVKVLDPIPYSSFKDMPPKDLALRMKDIIANDLELLKQEK